MTYCYNQVQKHQCLRAWLYEFQYYHYHYHVYYHKSRNSHPHPSRIFPIARKCSKEIEWCQESESYQRNQSCRADDEIAPWWDPLLEQPMPCGFASRPCIHVENKTVRNSFREYQCLRWNQYVRYQNVILDPTVQGTNDPGMCFSIANLARQPEQWPGMSTAGSSRLRSATVFWIWSASLVARWNPPTTAWTGTDPPVSSTACLVVLTTPAWLHPVKTTRPFPINC